MKCGEAECRRQGSIDCVTGTEQLYGQIQGHIIKVLCADTRADPDGISLREISRVELEAAEEHVCSVYVTADCTYVFVLLQMQSVLNNGFQHFREVEAVLNVAMTLGWPLSQLCHDNK